MYLIIALLFSLHTLLITPMNNHAQLYHTINSLSEQEKSALQGLLKLRFGLQFGSKIANKKRTYTPPEYRDPKEFPFACDVCGVRYKSEYSTRRHKRIKHSDNKAHY